jgi:YVTN family beta-propeller protein
MEFRILGSLQVLAGERQIPLGGARQREVLAILLLHRGEVVSVDRVVDELWGERPPETATKTVQVYVSRLRRVLGDGVLVTRDGGYALEANGESVDADRFMRLADEGRQALNRGNPRGARETLTAALDLWRGPPLADLAYESFAQSEIARLEELRLVALEDRGEADLALGHHAGLVPELETLVREHPTRERLREELMLALYRSGRQVDALESYGDARRTLDDELGLEPGPRLQELERSILTHDPAIAAPPGNGAVAVLRRHRRGGTLLALGGGLLLAAAVAAVLLVSDDDPTAAIEENAVGLIDPESGRLSEQVPVGRGPIAAAVGAGSVWVANQRDGTVSRVDADTRQVTTIDVGGDVSALAFGRGSLWVASAQRRGVSQVDPDTNRVLTTIHVGNTPRGVAVAFGAVWVANTVDGTVTRIDLAREGPTKRIAVGARPTAVAAGAGALWVASETSGTVTRIEAESGRVVKAINVGHGPTAVEFGGGAVWVANRQDGTVSRVDPATGAVTDTLPVGAEPTAIVAGEGGIWVANGGEGTVARVDPGPRHVGEKIEVGGSPSALAIAEGSVWTTAVAPRASHRGGTLRLLWPNIGPASCRCVDPIAYDDVQSWWLTSLAYDGLVTYRRVGGSGGATLVGNLAFDVPSPSADGVTYVFELRSGIRFSDGAPVRPEDFRHSLERLLRLNPTGSDYYDGILGARECRAEPRSCDLSKGIETDPGARTITVHLRAPDADFLHKLTLPLASVVPSDSPARYARDTPLPGTGPYRIVSFGQREGGRLVRNRHFRVWSQDARPDGFADQIAIEVSSRAGRQLAAVRRGDADAASLSKALYNGTLKPARLRALAIRYGGQLHSAPEPQLDLMYMNVALPPFGDARVRRALNYAVDRAEIVELMGGRQAVEPTCQYLPPGFPGYRPHCRYTLDPNAAGGWSAPDWATARRLVRDSGTQGALVRIWVGRAQAAIGRYFASVLRRLGYRPTLRVFSTDTYWTAIPPATGRLVNLWWFGWLTDHLTPSSFIQPIFNCEALGPRSQLPPDFSPWCDPGLHAQMDRALAQQSSDPTAANALWESSDRRLADAAPAVPLFHRQHLTLVSHRVENVQHHLLWGILYDQLWVE